MTMWRAASIVALCGALMGTGARAGEGLCAPDRLDLRGDWGMARFSVELADDARSRARGLMQRESLGASEGMLFLYPKVGSPSFWMKNTLIPLDMIFVTPEGVVQHVHEPGSELRHPGFDAEIAAWPCPDPK